MTRTLFRGLAAALLFTAAAGVSAADTRETPAVSGFSGIRLAVPARMEIVQGDTESVVLEGASEDLARIETVVENGVLHFRTRERNVSWNWKPKIRISVNAKRLESLAISGAGHIEAKSVRAPAMKLSISGSGDIRIPQLDTDKADVSISGSGDIRVGGRAASLTTHISGSGDVKAERLETRQATVSISGSGEVAVWTRESLQVRIAGAGDVRYYGDPTVEKRIAGAGSVKRAGAAPT
jgi:hypothetical protein